MINKVKLILASIGALLVFGGALFVYDLNRKYMEEKEAKNRYMSNAKAYVDNANGLHAENRVLRLNRDDLSHSNDKLVQTIDSIRKSRKEPENKPGGMSAGTITTIHDTVKIIIRNPCDFKLDTTIKHNEFTKSTIKIEKDSLISTIEVNNTMVLNVYTERVFVNQYKNGWIRFWNFDWKKEDVLKYSIDNSNKLIHIDDMRVIKHE